MRGFHFVPRGLRLLLAAMVVTLVLPVHAVEDAKMLSFRGIRAYEEGRFALAESFFERSVRDALLKGERESAVMATANWIDVLLETSQVEKALRVANAVLPAPKAQCALLQWKRGQIFLALAQLGDAISAFDSAIAQDLSESLKERIELDRTRAQWLAGDTLQAIAMAEKKKGVSKPNLVPGWLALLADMEMSRQGYARADSLLVVALQGYRASHRYARTTVLLWKQAICASALGQRERSVRLLREALTIANEIGIEPAGMEKIFMGLMPSNRLPDIAKSPMGIDFDGTGEHQDDLGRPTTGLDDDIEKSVSLPLDGAPPR